jgi:uroporphyrin-III C-methyltransferase
MSEAPNQPPSASLADDASTQLQPLPELRLPKPSRATLILVALVLFALVVSGSLWIKLSSIQEALARQSLDATSAAMEAKSLAKTAQEAVKDITTRQAVLENQLREVALQRGQLDELMQSLSRSRDENLVVDLDSAIRLAQQQANLTGSLEPLLAALRSAEQRVSRARLPRLAPLQRALAKDIERVKSANVADTPSLLIKFDELVRLADEMPVANAVAGTSKSELRGPATRQLSDERPQPSGLLSAAPSWLKTSVSAVRDELRALVRVSRIDTPEAALLSPEQSFFARENFKLKLLNARLALLSRQFDAARNDLSGAVRLNARYFDPASRQTQQAAALMTQVQNQMRSAEQPRIDDTLSALAALAASSAQGR